ncbi:Spermatogenesis-associated protein 4 [Lamellibrachia satsuma]|nr:Spermatogenesis-associated protein 4 [Lamellibrachia satsuma]
MSGLPREVLKWLQSLDLSWQIKCPKWDFSNGYLLAEIFSWYFPQDIEMHNYNTGDSLFSKQLNWTILKLFIKRCKLDIPNDYIEATLHCKEGGAVLLMERVYQILTNRQIRKVVPEYEIDFTDNAYQQRLPMHARTTVAMSLKNNLRLTELLADRNNILAQEKAQVIINSHIERRKQERHEAPDRFNVQPSLGECSVRQPPPVRIQSDTQTTSNISVKMGVHPDPKLKSDKSMEHEPTVQFKEVSVRQMDRKGQVK